MTTFSPKIVGHVLTRKSIARFFEIVRAHAAPG
mgnify:CR=1 FL=1